MQVLVNHRTEDTLALLMRLCTQGDPSQGDADYIAELSEFAALYSYKCALCEEAGCAMTGLLGHGKLCCCGPAATHEVSQSLLQGKMACTSEFRI